MARAEKSFLVLLLDAIKVKRYSSAAEDVHEKISKFDKGNNGKAGKAQLGVNRFECALAIAILVENRPTSSLAGNASFRREANPNHDECR